MGKRIDKTISQLLADVSYIAYNGSDACSVQGIAFSSADVEPGDAFFCVPGLKVDGHSFAADAVARGAAALVCQHQVEVDVAQFVVEDTRKTLALAAARAFDDPSSKLQVIGITGTNGKTTTTYLVEGILAQAGKKPGLIGTVEIRLAGMRLPSKHTTPESYELQELLDRMVQEGCDTCVMEASSHAIDLGRVRGVHFAVAAFSQLSQDHLDYHQNMENYYQAKRALFFDHEVRQAVVCVDDEYGRRLAQELQDAEKPVFTCGFSPEANLQACDVTYGPRSTTFTFVEGDEQVVCTLPLIGSYNVDNALLAAAICCNLGLSLRQIAHALQKVPQVPGRLERVSGAQQQEFSVFVDYAHTPDALEKATHVVSQITLGRTIVVFGCGGDRDRTKRPKMGAAALLADYVVVTSDNPRSEDPEAIIQDILPGMEQGKGRYEVVLDRRQAIARALQLAQPKDSVLIAGKGHEDYQLVGDQVLSFDDRLVAAEEMDALCN